MEDIIKAREKLDALVEVIDDRDMSSIGDFVDNLSEEESKIILKMLVYGDWRKLDRGESDALHLKYRPQTFEGERRPKNE